MCFSCISYLTALSHSSTVMVHCDDAELKKARHEEDVCRGTIKNYVCHIIVLLNKVHPGLRHYSSSYNISIRTFHSTTTASARPYPKPSQCFMTTCKDYTHLLLLFNDDASSTLFGLFVLWQAIKHVAKFFTTGYARE